MTEPSRVFLVSGASRGLGRAIVDAALFAGHRVVAGVRSTSALDDLAARHPDRLAVVGLDVTDDDDVRAAITTTVDRFGCLDVLVNNAGYANMAPIEDVDFDDFRAQLDTNFLGVVRLTRAALPIMRARRAGHIVQVSSVGGRLVRPGLAAYQSASGRSPDSPAYSPKRSRRWASRSPSWNPEGCAPIGQVLPCASIPCATNTQPPSALQRR